MNFKKLKQSAKKFVKGSGKVVGDYGKFLAKSVVTPINTLTGHNYDPKLQTKFFKNADKITSAVWKQGATVGGSMLGVGDLNGILSKKKNQPALESGVFEDDGFTHPAKDKKPSFWDFLLY